MELIKGVDISHHNNDRGPIDWSRVKAEGYSYALIKLTEGTTFIDSMGLNNVLDAQNAGFTVGAYHFARFNSKDAAIAEAYFFKEYIKKNGIKLSYAVLDIEHPEAQGDLTEAAIVFLESVKEIARPVFYSYPYFIKNHFRSQVSIYPLWIAHYGVASPTVPIWPSWQIWQQRSDGIVPGIVGNVDIDVMKPEFFIAGDDNMIERLIIASDDGDWCAASLAAYKYGCPVILKDVYENNKAANQAKQYIVIGGPESYNPGTNTIHLTGSDRLATALKSLS